MKIGVNQNPRERMKIREYVLIFERREDKTRDSEVEELG